MIYDNLARPSFYNDGRDPTYTAPFTSKFYAGIRQQIGDIRKVKEKSRQKADSWLPDSDTMVTIGEVAGTAFRVGMEMHRQNADSKANGSAAHVVQQSGSNYNNQSHVTVNNHQHIVTEAERMQNQESQTTAARAGAGVVGVAIAAPAAHQATKQFFAISKINAKIKRLDKFDNFFNADRQNFAGLPHLNMLDKAIGNRRQALTREANYAIAKLSTLVAAVVAGAFVAIAALSAPSLIGMATALLVPSALAAIVTWTAAAWDKTSQKCNKKAKHLFQILQQEKQQLSAQSPPNWQPAASAPLEDQPGVICSHGGLYILKDNNWYTFDGSWRWDEPSDNWQPANGDLLSDDGLAYQRNGQWYSIDGEWILDANRNQWVHQHA